MPVTAPASSAAPDISRWAPRCAALVLAVAALLGSLLAGAPAASAHAALTGSDPRDGAVVDSAPKEVTLTFSESVALSEDSLRVLDPQGERADTGEPRALPGEGARYAVKLAPDLPDGTFTVAWQVVSADSHPVSGAFTFSIGAPSETSVSLPAAGAGGGVVGLLYQTARYVAYAGFVLLVGAPVFVLACWPRGAGLRPVQRMVSRGWVALAAASIVLLLLRPAYTGSGRLSDVFDLGGLGAVLATKPGTALVCRLLLLTAAAFCVAVLFGEYARAVGASDGERSAKQRRLTLGLTAGGTVLAVGLAATWALAEHASAGPQPLVAMPMDVLHLLAVAAWLGGLAALLVSLRQARPAVSRAAVARFSRLAFGSVLVLVVTGLYQSWRQVGSWEGLTSTSYGRLLLAKVGLVAVMVGLARTSRRWVARLAAVPESVSEPVAEPGSVPRSASEPVPEPRKPLSGADAGAAGGGQGNAPTAPAARDRTATAEGPGDGPADPVREAQLARQRASMEAARRRRARDADQERSGLRRSVLAETCVAVLLLAVTTVLTNTEPARTEQAARSAGATAPAPDRPASVEIPFDTGGENGSGRALVDIDPGRTGANAVHLRLVGADDEPLDAPEVRMSLTLDSKEIGPLPVEPAKVSAGHWSAQGVRLPLAGDWTVSLTVRTSEIDQVTEERNVKIAP
ncbi:copper resistance CopC/CopD family protein [Streptomyces sp. TP-A0874]|uniref:copper resistance CopC/CopD family protein n=1 Tax=Streptomyces sp. TP-A0874 TaxID=549819 RepID=UPI000853BC44|nr:copper resistance protein CopC [Streptomyces sp. TP-A0874]